MKTTFDIVTCPDCGKPTIPLKNGAIGCAGFVCADLPSYEEIEEKLAINEAMEVIHG
jgi:uncharacterized Zn finger protein (UPF0148 family)